MTFVRDTHLQKFLQINIVVQHDTHMHAPVCLPALSDSQCMTEWLSHTPAPTEVVHVSWFP